jgi:hypothetical protein
MYLDHQDREPSWIPPLQSATLAQVGYVAERQVD